LSWLEAVKKSAYNQHRLKTVLKNSSGDRSLTVAARYAAVNASVSILSRDRQEAVFSVATLCISYRGRTGFSRCWCAILSQLSVTPLLL
jgi:hypothetical protein